MSPSPSVTVAAYVANGWEVALDNNRGKTVGVAPRPAPGRRRRAGRERLVRAGSRRARMPSSARCSPPTPRCSPCPGSSSGVEANYGRQLVGGGATGTWTGVSGTAFWRLGRSMGITRARRRPCATRTASRPAPPRRSNRSRSPPGISTGKRRRGSSRASSTPRSGCRHSRCARRCASITPTSRSSRLLGRQPSATPNVRGIARAGVPLLSGVAMPYDLGRFDARAVARHLPARHIRARLPVRWLDGSDLRRLHAGACGPHVRRADRAVAPETTMVMEHPMQMSDFAAGDTTEVHLVDTKLLVQDTHVHVPMYGVIAGAAVARRARPWPARRAGGLR